MLRQPLLYKIVKKLLIIPNHCLPRQTPVLYTRSQYPLKLTQLQSKLDVRIQIFIFTQNNHSMELPVNPRH